MMSFIQSLWGPNGLILLGALLSTVGVIWGANVQSGVNEELKDKSSKIIEQNRELNKKSEEIAYLNKENINHTTGGDSYPEVIFSSLNVADNSGQLVISNTSDNYAMFDLQLRIVDLASAKKRTLDDMLADDALIDIEIIPASTVSSRGKISLGDVTEKNLNIFSQTRNSSFTQMIQLKKLNNKWVQATKIFKTKTGEVLKEKIDSEFPLNKDGLVDWQ